MTHETLPRHKQPPYRRSRTTKIQVSGDIVDRKTVQAAAGIPRELLRYSRLEVLDLLSQHAPDSLSVTDIETRLRDYCQSEVSQILASLRRIGAVKATRAGKYIYYEINTAKWAEISLAIRTLADLNA